MTVGTLLLGLLSLTLAYAMRTLLGMRHRRVYPVLGSRDFDGTRTLHSVQRPGRDELEQGGTP